MTASTIKQSNNSSIVRQPEQTRTAKTPTYFDPNNTKAAAAAAKAATIGSNKK